MPSPSIPASPPSGACRPTADPDPFGPGLSRTLATGLLGSAAFGAAAAAGHGVHAMLHGAWAAPAIFVGGAALAAPPLYLFSALSGGRLPASDAIAAIGRPLASVATLLLGLSGPAAYLSVTLRTWLGPAILVGTILALGTAGVVAAGRAALAGESGAGPRVATALWGVFALALGGRLVVAASHVAGLWGAL